MFEIGLRPRDEQRQKLHLAADTPIKVMVSLLSAECPALHFLIRFLDYMKKTRVFS